MPISKKVAAKKVPVKGALFKAPIAVKKKSQAVKNSAGKIMPSEPLPYSASPPAPWPF